MEGFGEYPNTRRAMYFRLDQVKALLCFGSGGATKLLLPRCDVDCQFPARQAVEALSFTIRRLTAGLPFSKRAPHIRHIR